VEATGASVYRLASAVEDGGGGCRRSRAGGGGSGGVSHPALRSSGAREMETTVACVVGFGTKQVGCGAEDKAG
jgi:hypothetical protein